MTHAKPKWVGEERWARLEKDGLRAVYSKAMNHFSQTEMNGMFPEFEIIRVLILPAPKRKGKKK